MATIVIVIAVSLLFGSIILMLAMGYRETEREREVEATARRVESAQQAAAVGTVLGFFSPAQTVKSSERRAFSDALVSRLEHDIQVEQAIVAEFVHHPSLDALYSHPAASSLMQ